MKRNILLISIAVLFIIIVILIAFMGITTRKNSEQENNNIIIAEENIEGQIEEVKSATAFFTVQSCVNKYINYITSKDADSVLKLLDSQYVGENNITIDNVLDKVEKISGEIIFNAEKMYSEEIDDNNIIYYVHGSLKEEGLEIFETINNDFNITVNMDFNNNIFSIIPFGNGGLFNEKSD